jgi:hypothetical protein
MREVGCVKHIDQVFFTPGNEAEIFPADQRQSAGVWFAPQLQYGSLGDIFAGT